MTLEVVRLSNTSSDYKSIYVATEKFRDVRLQHWLKNDLFSPTWWLLLVLTIVPWLVWWKLADRKRLTELICFASLIAVICVVLDAIGTVNLWWMYKSELLIQFPGLLVADISDIPVAFMLVHQYCATWKFFLIWSAVFSALFAYVGEPLLRLAEAYNPLSWLHFYSFVIYLAMAALIRLTVLKMKGAGIQPSQDSTR